MLKELNILMEMSIEDIISSTHSLTLLKIYSKLYLNGGQPRTCEASLRKYYSELKKNYEMAKDVLNRTCKPSFSGRIYIPGIFKDGKLVAGHLHISADHLTDEKAKKYLKDGVLKEKHFIVLPDGEVSTDIIKTEYTKEELIEVIERDDFNELAKIGKELGLFEKRGKKDEMLKALNDYVITLNK